jgi:hypothetical protein
VTPRRCCLCPCRSSVCPPRRRRRPGGSPCRCGDSCIPCRQGRESRQEKRVHANKRTQQAHTTGKRMHLQTQSSWAPTQSLLAHQGLCGGDVGAIQHDAPQISGGQLPIESLPGRRNTFESVEEAAAGLSESEGGLLISYVITLRFEPPSAIRAPLILASIVSSVGDLEVEGECRLSGGAL